jgi:hypothetical protein
MSALSSAVKYPTPKESPLSVEVIYVKAPTVDATPPYATLLLSEPLKSQKMT